MNVAALSDTNCSVYESITRLQKSTKNEVKDAGTVSKDLSWTTCAAEVTNGKAGFAVLLGTRSGGLYLYQLSQDVSSPSRII